MKIGQTIKDEPDLSNASSKEKRVKFKCDMCDYEAARSTSLVNHKETKHKHGKENDVDSRQFECETCDYKSIDNISLETHRKNNHLNQDQIRSEQESNVNDKRYTKRMSSYEFSCSNCDFSTKK